MPGVARARAALHPVTGLPRMRISPLVGLTTPDRILISVDLPGAVVADEADHLAAVDAEIDPTQGIDVGHRTC
ncbi:hypothetical protein ACFSQT_35750 [Mesorhizobium calcicola]|uniref:Uncharacterized protein n=1 Tax=Mesorhizobium calcicola TaxID=1300310 RepID=A0ABW4WNV9_9HYPH